MAEFAYDHREEIRTTSFDKLKEYALNRTNLDYEFRCIFISILV